MKEAVFKNKNFMMLWIGQSISVLGNRFYGIALMWYMIEATGSSMALGITVLCFTLPAILLMPFAGVLADKNRKKQIIVSTDILNGIIMLIIAALIAQGSTPLIWLYVLMIAASSMSAFFNPALSASVPLIVGKEQLPKANSLTQLTNQLSNIIGPALAGVLIAMTDMWLLFLLNGVSYLLSAILEMFIKIPDIQAKSQEKLPFSKQFKEGLVHVLQSKKVLHLIIVGGVIINFFLAPLNVYITVICNQLLDVGAKGLGIIEAAISVGALGGSIFVLLGLMKNKVRMAIIGLVLEGVSLIIAGSVLSYPTMIIFALLLGLGVSFASVGISTLFQTTIPEEKMGRVMSIGGTLSSCTVPLGTLAGSAIINHVSMEIVFVISGIIVFLAGLSLVVPFMEEMGSNKVVKREQEQAI